MGPMDWDFGSFGGQSLWSLESWGKGTVMFCDVYVLRGGILYHWRSWRSISPVSILWDVGCTEVGAGDLYFTTMVLGFCVYLKKQSLDKGRVVAKESHSFIWWVAIVNPSKEV